VSEFLSGFWKPRAYRHEGVPTLQELTSFLRILKEKASHSTYSLFEGFARLPPTTRVMEAMTKTLKMMSENPGLVENRENEEVLKRVLDVNEYTSLVEIVSIPDFTQAHRITAESLLCLSDRAVISQFCKTVFINLRDKSYIHELDEE
jgi:hypothetical protein